MDGDSVVPEYQRAACAFIEMQIACCEAQIVKLKEARDLLSFNLSKVAPQLYRTEKQEKLDRIVKFLKANGPATLRFIAIETGCDYFRVRYIVQREPDIFHRRGNVYSLKEPTCESA